MFLSSQRSHLFLLLIIFSPVKAMKPFHAKKLMYQHLSTLKKEKNLCIQKLSQNARHKLLLTAYNSKHEQMFTIYLNDWVIKQCARSNYIVHQKNKNITVKDIENHLAKAWQLVFPTELYQLIGKKIIEFYIIPHIENQAKKITDEIKNALTDLEQKVNQSMAIILIYTYDACQRKQSTLYLPQQSNTAKILKNLKPNTQQVLKRYLNFKIV